MAKVNKKRAAKRAKQSATNPQRTQQPSPQLVEQMRLRLTGRLQNTAPVHIGSGSLKAKELDNADEKALPVLQIVRDHQGLPYIPGSSLRGLIRQHATSRSWPEALFQRLFGTPKPEKGTQPAKDSAIQMGMLTVLDAYVSSTQEVTERPRVSIDARTNTAKSSHLFALETVPEGASFSVTLELEAIGNHALTVADMASLADLLEDLNQENELLLGNGKSIGQCTFVWTPKNGRVIERISKKDLIAWICGTSASTQFDQLWKPDTLPSRNSHKNKSRGNTEQGHQSEWLTIPLSIFPQSAFLINANVEKPKAGENAPAAVFQKNRYGQAEIPGSSLKGLFRAHCRKILLTLCDDNDVANALTNQLFGSVSHASRVRVQSALSQQSLRIQEQYFNAIDRFTGGVKDTALYHVQAAYCQQLKGAIKIQTPFFKDNPWAQALLIMLMRDSIDEDLNIGWGKTKGFGQTSFNWHFPDTMVQSWSQLYEHWHSLDLLDASIEFESLPEVLLKAIGDEKEKV